MLAHFRMLGEDGIMTVQPKYDHSPVFIGELMHACYQVLPLARQNMIYTAATYFWQQALVHSSARFCSTATDIYADGSILHKRTSNFFCPGCAKHNSKHSVPLPVWNLQSKNRFDLIHSDLLVPVSVESLCGRKYVLTFVEHKTRYSEVNFLYKESDAARLIQAFCKKVSVKRLILKQKDIHDLSVLTKEASLAMKICNRTLKKKVSRTSKPPPTITNPMA